MASRDRYDIELMCPKCHNEGILKISENDYPFMRKADREARSVDGNFEVIFVDDTKIKLKCNKCNETYLK